MGLKNGTSYFGRFKWRDDPRLAAAIERLMSNPIRVKVSLGAEQFSKGVYSTDSGRGEKEAKGVSRGPAST